MTSEDIIKCVAERVTAFCREECPVNTEEFGGELPNPQDCVRGCPCLGRDIWFILSDGSSNKRGG